MNYSPRRLYAEKHSLPSCDHFRPWPISAGKLVSLIDLGWSDYRIACYFCVEPVKVSALRAYYGLVGHAQESWVSRMRRRHRLQSEARISSSRRSESQADKCPLCVISGH